MTSMASSSEELQSTPAIIDLEAEGDVPVPAPYASVSTILDANPPSAYLGQRTELQDDLTQASLKAMTLAFEQTLRHESTSLPYINEMLTSLNPSNAPQTRSSKNKEKKEQTKLQLSETPLTTLITSGMDAEQIWEQLEMRSKGLCEMLDKILDPSPEMADEDDDEENGEDEDEDSSIDWDGEMDEDESEEEVDEDTDAMDVDPKTAQERLDNLRDTSPAMSLDLDAPPSPPRKSKKKKSNKHGLDDDFFSLDAFNAEAEEAEAKSVSKGRLADDSEESEEEDLDLFAPVDDIEAEDDAGEAYYNDFFVATAAAPKKSKAPAKSAAVRFHDQVRVREIERKGKGRPLNTMSLLSSAMDDDEEEDDEDEEDTDDEEDEDAFGEDMGMDMEVDLEGGEDSEEGSEDESSDEENAQHTMDRFQDDLFADEDGQDAEEEELTAHEKRMRELTEQIVSLEAENVGSKEWVLTGEASTRSRPQNSLLEQDLEFDRNNKSTAPVITEEVVASLEEKIKKRILDNDFDDVVRIRAPAERDYLPSRLVELNDKKSGKSLAELYEDDYVHGVGKDGEDRDGKLKKEHDELEKTWDDICAKLDALANAHWVPKAPKTTISSISNVATASLESALPTTLSTSTLLAPQEIFTPAATANKARSEMTPAEKQALHNKQRKIRKKQNEAIEKLKDGRGKSRLSVKQQKQEALKSVVKSGKGVTVVGKQPETGKKKGKPRQP